MQLRRRWQACGWLLVSLCLVWLAIFTGCEKAGDGGGGGTAETPPPPPPPPVIVDIASITLATGEDALFADGTSFTTVTATLVNSAGEPSPDGITVTFTTDKGRFTPEGSKTAAATTSGGTGIVVVPFISEPAVIGTATIVASANGVATSTQIALAGPGEPAQIILTVDATTIPLGGTTGISAQILDDGSNKVADGTPVLFATNLPGTAVTPSATTIGGTANAIFSGGINAGVAAVTAIAGNASASISITIQAAGSLDFVSAEPTIIGVRGSPLQQISTITFRVLDQNGTPAADNTLVSFAVISGLGGGEFVFPTTIGTVAGRASTVLTSGTVAGPVRIRASVTVGTNTLTSSSTNVSIIGGTPSGAHMGVAPEFLNIAGLVTQGLICSVTAILGDRFGNPVTATIQEDSSGNLVLGQTPVSFFSNGGVIGPVGLTDNLGNAPTQIKTGPPTPRVINSGDPNFNPNTDPRTGFVTIIAVTQGEETFIDSNGNGLFDGPQEFDPSDPELDTPEPFIDHVTLCNGNPPSSPTPCPSAATVSGDGQFDPTDRFELFIDGNNNGTWDTPNGVWDANKPIFASTRVLFSGPTVLQVQPFINGICVNGNPNGFSLPPGGAAEFCILVSDLAGHPLVSGTTISVTTSAGTVGGTTAVTLPDTQFSGPGTTLFRFTIINDAPADTEKTASVLVSVKSPPTDTCRGVNGDRDFPFVGTVEAKPPEPGPM